MIALAIIGSLSLLAWYIVIGVQLYEDGSDQDINSLERWYWMGWGPVIGTVICLPLVAAGVM